MNNDNLHSLPPDADDLSVHAPLLNSLVRGNDFVVPDHYFDSLPETVLAQTILPSASGLTALESNYWVDFTERIEALIQLPDAGEFIRPDETTDITTQIISLTELPTESGLTVPADYFSDFADQLSARLSLPETNSTALTEVSEAYFSEATEELPVLLALDNLKQDEGYTTPEHYFEELTSKVMEHTSAELLGDGSDADVPAEYFENLPERILARTQATGAAESKVIRLTTTTQRWRITAVAASVALLVGVAVWLSNDTPQTGSSIAFTPKAIQLPSYSNTFPTPEGTAEMPVEKVKQPYKQKAPQPETRLAVDVELIDEYTLVDYAAEQLGQITQAPDADAELRYYLENTELGEILSPGN